MKLSAENVNNVFTNCLFTEEETQDVALISRALVVEGVYLKVGYHPNRIQQNRENIISMLNCLPNSFKPEGGGGMSFLNMMEDKDGEQWTGLHQEMDKLVTLGLATQKLSFLMPREIWKVLPGGMPYVVVKNLKMERKEKLDKINIK